MCVESSGHRRRRTDRRAGTPRPGSGRRTGVSAFAAKVPRKPVWKRKYRKSAKKPTCDDAAHPDERADDLARGDAGAGELRIDLLLLAAAPPGRVAVADAARARAPRRGAPRFSARRHRAVAVARRGVAGAAAALAGVHVVSRSIGVTRADVARLPRDRLDVRRASCVARRCERRVIDRARRPA